MKFSDEQITNLAECVKSRLSEKRFRHVQCVVDAAKRIGRFFDEIDISELSAAALLHDITKELDVSEHLALFDEYGVKISDEDRDTVSILHSLTAPFFTLKHFPEFATESVLSALKNHTTGESGMSIFDRIIFIADYVEDSRIYDSCVKVREELFSALSLLNNHEKNEYALNKAVYDSLVFTEKDVLKRGRILNSRSFSTKEYFCAVLSESV